MIGAVFSLPAPSPEGFPVGFSLCLLGLPDAFEFSSFMAPDSAGSPAPLPYEPGLLADAEMRPPFLFALIRPDIGKPLSNLTSVKFDSDFCRFYG